MIFPVPYVPPMLPASPVTQEIEFVRADVVQAEHKDRRPESAGFSVEDERLMQRLVDDGRFYSESALKIKTDEGIVPFKWNIVQEYLNWRAEEQIKRIGYVRMILVKARQQGGSEGIGGRAFKYATQNTAKTVYILSHERGSTAKLFAKVERYYRYAPEGMVPGLRASNRNQMLFDNESEYTVGTAGSDNTGRGDTVQFLHLSEPAHYVNPDSIKAGIVQTISNRPGTEIWWESTANGRNWFYEWVVKVLNEKGQYEVIFVPWCWSDKYWMQPPDDFERTEEEVKIADLGTIWDLDSKLIEKRILTDGQLYWRREKIRELGLRLFKQEYPLFLEEAFQASGESFFDNEDVDTARKTRLKVDHSAPRIMGCDAARNGDRTIFCHRQGRSVSKNEEFKDMDEMRLAGLWIQRIDSGEVDYIMADPAYAHGAIDYCIAQGYGEFIIPVYAQSKPDDPIYHNKRAEMHFDARKWLKDYPCSLPDDEKMALDLASIPAPQTSHLGKIIFKSKEELREVLKRSPDYSDAFTLTFGRRVRIKTPNVQVQKQYDQGEYGGNRSSSSKTLNRFRGDNNGMAGGTSGDRWATGWGTRGS